MTAVCHLRQVSPDSFLFHALRGVACHLPDLIRSPVFRYRQLLALRALTRPHTILRHDIEKSGLNGIMIPHIAFITVMPHVP